jgi:hypothetical protein
MSLKIFHVKEDISVLLRIFKRFLNAQDNTAHNKTGI